MGRTTSDLVRRVGAARLRDIENLADFAEGCWVRRIAHMGDNPAVLRLLVERAVLGTLIASGTKVAGSEPEFNKSLKIQKFSGQLPSDVKRDGKGILYIPTTYNYWGADAILAVARVKKRDEAESRAFVVGIQVAMSNCHSDSEGAFMRSWRDWDELMASDVTIFRFVWIVETIGRGMTESWRDVPKKIATVQGKRSIVHPAYQRRYVSLMAFSEGLGKCLKAARG